MTTHLGAVTQTRWATWKQAVRQQFEARGVGDAFRYVDEGTLFYLFLREHKTPFEAYAWCCNQPVTH